MADVNSLSIAATWQHRALLANNVNITYYQSSPAANSSGSAAVLPILVFLHAMWLNGATLIVDTQSLTSSFSMVLPDARGHGFSSPVPTGSFTMTNLVADAVAVIKKVSPDAPVFLMGTSMGAATAARVARRYPSLVRALVLEEPPWIRFPGEAVQWSTIDPTTHTEMPAFVKQLQNMTDEEFDLMDEGSANLPDMAMTNLAAWRMFDIDNCEGTLGSVDSANNEAIPSIAMKTLLQIGDIEVTGSQINGSKIQPDVAKYIVKTYKDGALSFYSDGNHVLHEAPTAEKWFDEVQHFFSNQVGGSEED